MRTSPTSTIRTSGPFSLQRIQECEPDWCAALSRALEAREPVFVPLKHYCDDRGWSLMNLFTGVMSEQGQVNVSTQYPGVIKAWHRHEHQTDFWLCVSGHLKAGVYHESRSAAWSIVMGEKRPGVLIIPPTLWHGAATVGPTTATLLYYVTRAFDASNPDEQRRPWDSVPGFNWAVENK